jgi:hypothetical protein
MSISTPPPGPVPAIEAMKAAPTMGMAPAEFAASRVGGITSFLGSLIAPVATLALVGIGFKMVVTGEPPKMFRS